MIRRMLLPTMAFGLMTACTAASDTPDTSADKARIEAEAPAWFEHFNNGDANAVANMYTEDAVILPAGAPAVSGRAAAVPVRAVAGVMTTS